MRGGSWSNWSSADKGKQSTRGAGQITVFAMEHVNWNGRLQTWNIDGAQRFKPQLLLDDAFRQECNPNPPRSIASGLSSDGHDRHIV
jgi:hypothetical protein